MPRSDYDDRQRDPYGRFARDRDDDRGYHGRGRMTGVGGGADRDRDRDRDLRDDDRDRFFSRATGRDHEDHGRYEQRFDRDREEFGSGYRGGGYDGGDDHGGGRRFDRGRQQWNDDEDRPRFRDSAPSSYDRERDEYGRFASERGERGVDRGDTRPLSGRDREDYGRGRPPGRERDDDGGRSVSRSRSRTGRDDERPAGNQPGHPFYGNQYSRGRHNGHDR